MKRPIHLAISLNKCDSGGQKSLVFAYLRSFDPKRIKFDLIVDSDSNSIPYDDVKDLGGKLHVIPPYQNIVAHLKALKKIFRENKYDVLYAVNNTMNLFPLYIAYKAGIKVRVSESLTMASPLERKKTMMKNVLKRFSHCFCNYMMANGKDCGIYQFGEKAYNQGKVEIYLTPVNAKENTLYITDNTRFIFEAIDINFSIRSLVLAANEYSKEYKLPTLVYNAFLSTLRNDRLFALIVSKMNVDTVQIRELISILSSLENLKFVILDFEMMTIDLIDEIVNNYIKKNKKILFCAVSGGELEVNNEEKELMIKQVNNNFKYFIYTPHINLCLD